MIRQLIVGHSVSPWVASVRRFVGWMLVGLITTAAVDTALRFI